MKQIFSLERKLLTARLLLVVVLFLDGWLAWHALSGTIVAGCGGAEGCDQVLSSKWGYWIHLPVSLPAMGVHFALLALSFLPKGKHTTVPRVWNFMMGGLCISLWVAAVWFVVIMAFVLEHYCIFCLCLHGLGSLAALILIQTLCDSRASWFKASLMGMGSVTVIALAVGQILFPKELIDVHPTVIAPMSAMAGNVSHDPGARSIPQILGAGLGEIDPALYPHLGNPKADRVAALVFDFTCAQCRKSHEALQLFIDGHSDNVCLVLLPAALNPQCNPYIANLLPEHEDACDYARLSLALWQNSPEDFHAFTKVFLTATPAASPVAEARAWAEHRVGKEKLEALLSDPAVDAQLKRNIDTFANAVRETNRLEMPKLITAGTIISGAPDSIDTYRIKLDPITGVWWAK